MPDPGWSMEEHRARHEARRREAARRELLKAAAARGEAVAGEHVTIEAAIDAQIAACDYGFELGREFGDLTTD